MTSPAHNTADSVRARDIVGSPAAVQEVCWQLARLANLYLTGLCYQNDRHEQFLENCSEETQCYLSFWLPFLTARLGDQTEEEKSILRRFSASGIKLTQKDEDVLDLLARALPIDSLNNVPFWSQWWYRCDQDALKEVQAHFERHPLIIGDLSISHLV